MLLIGVTQMRKFVLLAAGNMTLLKSTKGGRSYKLINVWCSGTVVQTRAAIVLLSFCLSSKLI